MNIGTKIGDELDNKYTKDGYYAELVVPHANCSLLYLKEKYNDSIKNVRLVPFFGGNGREQYETRMSTDFNISKELIDDISTMDNIELIGDVITKNCLEICLGVKDDVLNILTKTLGGNGGFSMPRYDLLSNYEPLGHSAEYFYLSVPDKKLFINETLDKLRSVSFNKKIDWRTQKGWEIRKIPFLTLLEQHIADFVVESGYIDDFNVERLGGLSKELDMNIDELHDKADEIIGEIYLEFLGEAYKDMI